MRRDPLFRGRVDSLEMMQEAVATHATRLGEKLRHHGLATDHVTLFFYTSPHDRGPSRSVSTTVDFPEASNDTLVLVRAAKWSARRIWKNGYRYAKVGLMSVDIVSLKASQRALIGSLDREKSGRLMEALEPATPSTDAAPSSLQPQASQGSEKPKSRNSTCGRLGTRRD